MRRWPAPTWQSVKGRLSRQLAQRRHRRLWSVWQVARPCSTDRRRRCRPLPRPRPRPHGSYTNRSRPLSRRPTATAERRGRRATTPSAAPCGSTTRVSTDAATEAGSRTMRPQTITRRASASAGPSPATWATGIRAARVTTCGSIGTRGISALPLTSAVCRIPIRGFRAPCTRTGPARLRWASREMRRPADVLSWLAATVAACAATVLLFVLFRLHWQRPVSPR